MKSSLLLTALLGIILITCTEKQLMQLEKTPFGEVDGKAVDLYSVSFESGLQAKVTNYGGIITSLFVPDRNGEIEDVVLGYDSLQGYLTKTPYFGALIGRYGNRIAKGQFLLDGKEYSLATNNGVNHLHGGVKGFDKVVWEVIANYRTSDSIGITLKYVSQDGESGYPGTLTSLVQYTFTPNSLKISYQATTDAPTVVNLTQHTYFNLSGNVAEDILGHELILAASRYLPVDSTLIPTGEIRSVAETAFDFTSAKLIGKEIEAEDEQLDFGKGYDHCWVLDGGQTKASRLIGSLTHAGSGRAMDIYTTEPAIQFYSGNFLDGSLTGKGGKVYEFRNGLCLETQHYPDSPNQYKFPNVVLRPGEDYSSETIYEFGIINSQSK